MQKITVISVGDRKKNPSVPFTAVKRQWKRERKTTGFSYQSNILKHWSWLSWFRNAILQFGMPTKKTTHIFTPPPIPPIQVNIRTIYWKQRDKKRNSSKTNINTKRYTRECDLHAKMPTMDPTTISNCECLSPSCFPDQEKSLLPRKESFSPKLCEVLVTPV